MSDHAVNGNGNAHGPSAALSLSSSSAQLLPPELWQHVLEVCHPSDLQHTALALSRAIPNAGITLKVRVMIMIMLHLCNVKADPGAAAPDRALLASFARIAEPLP
jgi:hypothetical protein